MSRTRYEADGDNAVAVTTPDGRRRYYWAIRGRLGGHVYDATDSPGTSGRQVYDYTAPAGTTLMWHPRTGSLADLMRRQIRARRRHEVRS